MESIGQETHARGQDKQHRPKNTGPMFKNPLPLM